MFSELSQFMQQNFVYIFLLSLLWCLGFSWMTWLGLKKRGLDFAELSSANVLFEETQASGCSHQSVFTLLGGGRKCLTWF